MLNGNICGFHEGKEVKYFLSTNMCGYAPESSMVGGESRIEVSETLLQ